MSVNDTQLPLDMIPCHLLLLPTSGIAMFKERFILTMFRGNLLRKSSREIRKYKVAQLLFINAYVIKKDKHFYCLEFIMSLRSSQSPATTTVPFFIFLVTVIERL